MWAWMKSYATIFLMAMTPIAELRVSIPAGLAMGLEPVPVVLLSILGGLIPVPFIMLFIRGILAWMKTKRMFCRFVQWIEQKADKGAKMFYKYELLGIFLLVAVPIPGTGAWTGSLVAAMLKLRMKTAIPAIWGGVITAALIVSALSLSIFSFFG